MKKLFLTMLLSLACLLGASAQTLTVCDGTDTNVYVPIYGYYVDTPGAKSQVLYPASELTSMVGKKITDITFYANGNITFSGGEQVVKVAELESSEMPGIVTEGLTTVFTGTVTRNGSQMTIHFDAPYQYAGGNLLISCDITDEGDEADTSFLGVITDYNSSYYKTNFSTGTGQKFLPKATFAYSEAQAFDAKVNKESIDFGTLRLNQLPKTEMVNLKNLGANAFTPSVAFSNSAFSTTYVASELAAAGSVEIPVVFEPSVAGNYEGTMTITAFEGEGGTFTVTLTGNAYSGTVAPETIDFGTIPFNKINEIAPKTVTWTNYSGAPITPNVSATTPFDATWAAEVADGASVEIPVTFAPNAKGEYTGTLTIDAGTAGTYTVALTGVVGDEVYDITVCNGTETNSFVPIYGNNFDATTHTSQMIYPAEMLTSLQGHKITSLTFYPTTNITINKGKATVSLMETENTTFESAALATGQFTDVATWAPSGNEETLVVTFNEPYLYRGGNLMIQFNKTENGSGYSGTYQSSLSFFGTIQENDVAYHMNNGYSNNSKLVKFLPKATFTYDNELDEYAACVNKENIDFGTSKLSELPKTETVTLRNLGANAFTPTVTLSNEAFTATYEVAELAAAGSVNIPIVFQPNTIGDYEGTMTINAGEAGTYTVALTGKAYGGAVVPESLDFGTTPFNQISNIEAKTVTLTNYSGETITPTVTATAPFGTTYEAAEVADGASVDIPVTFVPDAKGEFTGTLSINAGTAGNYTVALTGSVSDAVYNVTVCDGNDNNQYVPIYGINYDSYPHTSQMIYPAEMLTELKGHPITSITFYPSKTINITRGQATVSLMETENTTFESAALATGEFTDVATWVPSGADETLSLAFTTPYIYRGGNLIVQIAKNATATGTGSYQSNTFIGANQTGNDVAFHYENNSQNRLVQFLPKATFGYDNEQTVVVYDITLDNGSGTYKGNVTVKATVTPEMPEGATLKYTYVEDGATETPVEKDFDLAKGLTLTKKGTLTIILRDAEDAELDRTSATYDFTPLIGDVNGDGFVNVSDVNYVVNIILGKIHPND